MCQGLGPKKHDEISEIDRKVSREREQEAPRVMTQLLVDIDMLCCVMVCVIVCAIIGLVCLKCFMYVLLISSGQNKITRHYE